jgi:hypothetical protein
LKEAEDKEKMLREVRIHKTLKGQKEFLSFEYVLDDDKNVYIITQLGITCLRTILDRKK